MSTVTYYDDVSRTIYPLPQLFLSLLRSARRSTWYDLYGSAIRGERRTPFVPGNLDDLDFQNSEIGKDAIQQVTEWATRMVRKDIFSKRKAKVYQLSVCITLIQAVAIRAKKIALWHHLSLVHPVTRAGAAPNDDLDEDIRSNIDEARSILNLSPRRAAALLRLALQKVCKQLGEPGKDINTDIQSLVTKGMAPHLQQAFDAVRVIGNEAVHPGELDLRDDRETATILIDLINIVAQELISNKQSIASIYDRLPGGKLSGIQARARAAADKQSKLDRE